MTRWRLILPILLVRILPAQSPPAFEVASVRLATPESLRVPGPRIQTSHGTLTTHALPLLTCLQWAYQMQPVQISGPDWLAGVRLDIVAKAATQVDDKQLYLMLRTLLADRLGVKTHIERREMPVYALTPGKGGAKVTESTTEGPWSIELDKSMQIYHRLSMYEFASELSNTLGRPVVNATGLNGRYEFRMDPALVPLDLREDRPSWFIAAIEGQLGLKVESRKETLDVLVIDHAEKIPTEN